MVSFNIRNGRGLDGWNSWPFRARATATAIRRLRPDVAGLQEVFGFQERSLRRRLPGYLATSAGRDDGRRGERTTVLHRGDRFQVTDAQVRWFGDTPDVPGTRLPDASFPRTATLVRLRDADGTAVSVANTHLDERHPANRRRSLEQLVGWLGTDEPWIVTGDLNARPDDPILDVLRDAGFHDALPADAPGTNHDFTGRTDGSRIDYVWVRGWDVVEARVAAERIGRRLPSDHWPVVAVLRRR